MSVSGGALEGLRVLDLTQADADAPGAREGRLRLRARAGCHLAAAGSRRSGGGVGVVNHESPGRDCDVMRPTKTQNGFWGFGQTAVSSGLLARRLPCGGTGLLLRLHLPHQLRELRLRQLLQPARRAVVRRRAARQRRGTEQRTGEASAPLLHHSLLVGIQLLHVRHVLVHHTLHIAQRPGQLEMGTRDSAFAPPAFRPPAGGDGRRRRRAMRPRTKTSCTTLPAHCSSTPAATSP